MWALHAERISEQTPSASRKQRLPMRKAGNSPKQPKEKW